MKPARLYLWDDRFLWVSHTFKGTMTRRYATNLILAISAKPFLLNVPRKVAAPCRAALCSSRALRCVDATDVPFLSFNLDPGCADARRLEGASSGQPVALLDRQLFSEMDEEFAALLDGEADVDRARRMGDRLVEVVAPSGVRPASMDPRIRKVLDHLRDERPTDIDLEVLSGLAGLSSSRLMHLFSQQVGLPMSQFLLWGKMRQAVSQMQSGESLTAIAQRCGFADSSHLTRTFKTFYGIKPSVLSNSRYVQLIMN